MIDNTDIYDLVGKRLLLMTSTGTLEEDYVLEISPSQTYCKLQHYGWIGCQFVVASALEILPPEKTE